MSDTNNHQPFGPRPTPLLRAHKRAFILLFFYIPLVLIPWVITMLLVYRPAMRSYWTYPSSSPKHTSPGYSEVIEGFQWKDYEQQRGWTRAIPIMNAFAAILTIPVTSTVLAQAAVVFAQRRTPGQQLSARHLFSLADRAWLDWGMLHKMLYWHEAGSKRVKMFVFGGAILVLCGAIQYPLIQITVPWEQISVPTSQDTHFISDFRNSHSGYDFSSSKSHGYRLLGRDLEPAQMANLPADLILPHIADDLSTIQAGATLPSFWRTPDEYTHLRPSYRFLDYLDDESGFVATLPADTTTGVLREHIMRLNSSVSCTNLTVSAWPSTCSGTNPFQASFHYSEGYHEGNMTIDVCAPGDMGKHPWTFSRNRQELSEEVFFRFTGRDINKQQEFGEDDVVHCTAQTARGYFELGNAYNGEAFGPLLEKWSDVAQSHDFVEPDSYNGYQDRGFHPSEEDTWVGTATPAPSKGNQLPGPLTTSLLALFGPSSWAANIANLTANRTQANLDSTSDIPSGFLAPLCAAAPFASTGLAISSKYSQWCAVDGLAGLRSSLDSLLFGLDDPTMVKKWLDIAVFVANRATLTSHTHRLLDWPDVTGREIYTAEGLKVCKPSPSIAAQVILTLIVMVHVFGLLGVAYWLQRWPAWTRTLDSMAVARISTHLDSSLLPPLKTVRLSARAPLKDVDGLVGIQGAETVHAHPVRAGASQQEGMGMETLSIASTAGKQATSSATPMMAAAGAGSVELGLGAPGVIAKRGKKQVVPSTAVADV